MADELEKYDQESYLNKKEFSDNSPFIIEHPIESMKKMIQERGLTRAIKEANFHYRDRYVVRNKEFNSMTDLSEGNLPRLSQIRGFIPGKIYTYQYDPKHRLELDFYDRRPLMLSLGHFKAGNTVLEMGINLHFLPPKVVKKILELTWDVFQYKIEKNFEYLMKENYHQIPLPIYAKGKKIFEIIGKTNYKFAMRNYLRNRMKDVQIVEYTDWKYVPLLETKWVIGATKQEIWKLYGEDKIERKEKERLREERKQQRNERLDERNQRNEGRN